MWIYLIGMYDTSFHEYDGVHSIVKACTSYECARQYIYTHVECLKSSNDCVIDRFVETETKREFELEYHYTDRPHTFKQTYFINEIDLEENKNLPEAVKPKLEKRCEANEAINLDLRKDLAEYKKRVAAALCFLTFYDGGIYEDFDHLIDNLHKAKCILEGDDKSNDYILHMFEEWKKTQSGSKIEIP